LIKLFAVVPECSVHGWLGAQCQHSDISATAQSDTAASPVSLWLEEVCFLILSIRLKIVNFIVSLSCAHRVM